MDEPASFGYWVRRRRKALDLTQPALAARVGLSVAMICRIEAGQRRPSRQVAGLLAQVPNRCPQSGMPLSRPRAPNSPWTACHAPRSTLAPRCAGGR